MTRKPHYRIDRRVVKRLAERAGFLWSVDGDAAMRFADAIVEHRDRQIRGRLSEAYIEGLQNGREEGRDQERENECLERSLRD